ncbi:ETC complex I subunit [Acidocella sp.]|uniref:ETC complex I subunit n=1 Tax=Acidocella sp. TaxID=50710 RepID=UPI00260A6B68|nr:ETC complex I subunit [Acidocella sp.]
MRARIFLPPKSAMQSGLAGTHRWVLQYEPETQKIRDRLMGWTGSDDMRQQIKLTFESKDAAIAYAVAEGIPYDVEIPATRVKKPKSYADNFRVDRKENWTH